ncbi:MAG: DUF1064 domain-containing protein [Paraclostridium sp.]
MNKYRNIKCSLGTLKFDSILERNTYIWLSAFLKTKNLSDTIHLELQKRIPIIVNKSYGRISYVADFYLTRTDKECTPLIIDAKGCKTVAYKQKKILLKSIHGMDIYEVKTAEDTKKALDMWMSNE